MSSVETGQMSAVEARQMSAAATGQMKLLRQDRCLLLRLDRCKILKQGWSRRLKSAACRSNRDFWNSSGADRGRPAETGGVPGYGVKDTQADPPHPRAKARMTAVKQTPSNYDLDIAKPFAHMLWLQLDNLKG